MTRVLASVLVLAAVASADTFTFNFEDVLPGTAGGSITTFDGPASMTVASGGLLETEDISFGPGVPPTFGSSTLAAFGVPGALVVTFSGLGPGEMIGSISWEVGDFNLSDTDEYIVTVLDPFLAPTAIGGSGTIDGTLPPFGFGSVTPFVSSSLGIGGLLLGQTGGHSLYYDNFVVTTYDMTDPIEAAALAAIGDVPMGDFGGSGTAGSGGDSGRLAAAPEPAGLLLLCAGLAVVALRRRR